MSWGKGTADRDREQGTVTQTSCLSSLVRGWKPALRVGFAGRPFALPLLFLPCPPTRRGRNETVILGAAKNLAVPTEILCCAGDAANDVCTARGSESGRRYPLSPGPRSLCLMPTLAGHARENRAEPPVARQAWPSPQRTTPSTIQTRNYSWPHTKCEAQARAAQRDGLACASHLAGCALPPDCRGHE
jgi:hypothetical protein